MGIILRRARIEDKARALEVEAKATPGLRYLNVMFEHWVHDRDGDFRVAEIDGVLMGIGKFTVMPDGSAWLEALRVSPEAQGKGVGKQFYQHFFAVARERQIPQMRMYTGVRNAASKGLAERFGFRVAATFRGASRNIEVDFMARAADTFRVIADPVCARDILLPLNQPWAGYMVMNRTFYSITPEPVSYTHLDVYKRQALTKPPAPNFVPPKYLVTTQATFERPRFLITSSTGYPAVPLGLSLIHI